jgi:hypothetical protein
MCKNLLNPINIFVVSLLSLLTITLDVIANEESLYEKTKFESIWAAKDLLLKMKWQETREFKIPSIVKKKNHRIVLRLKARINSKRNSGWNNYLSLWLNRQPIKSVDRSNKLRFLNRSATFKTTKYGTQTYLNRNSLLLFFSPDFKGLRKELPKEVYREKFGYLLDITDLVDDIDMNFLKIKCTTVKNSFKGKEIGWGIIGNCEIGYIKKRLKTNDFKKTQLLSGKTIKMKDYSLVLSKGKGLEIKMANEQYFLESSFSYPNAGYNKFNYSNAFSAGNEDKLKISTKLVNKSFKITAKGRYYTLERSIEAKEERIEIEDKFVNLSSSEPLGIIINNCLFSNSKPKEVFSEGGSGNPTIFIAQQHSGLGIVVNDDIYRLQLRVAYENCKINFFTKNFGLKPNSSYTLKWVIYPRSVSPAKRAFPLTDNAGPDYWDFINQVRRDWKVNYVVGGPCEFIKITDTLLRSKTRKEIFAGKKPEYLLLRPWFEYCDGSSVIMNREQFAADWHKAVKVIKSLNSKVKCFASLEPTFTIPLKTEEIKDSSFKDSFVYDDNGNPMIVAQWWPIVKKVKGNGYIRKKGYEYVHTYLEKGNSRLKQFKEQCNFIFDELNADGVYLDLFGHTSTRRPGYRYSYNKWDGYTVDINSKSLNISKKYTDLALVASSGQAEALKDILSKGKVVIANYPAGTREMTNVHINRFSEISGNLLYCYKTHLGSPLALGTPWRTVSNHTTKRLMEDIIDYLNSGVLYYYYAVNYIDKPKNTSALSYCFPFTPIELHSGWLIGKERIITSKSGTFGWHDMSKVKGHLFDADGKELHFPFNSEKIKNELVTKIKLKPGQLVILERILPSNK